MPKKTNKQQFLDSLTKTTRALSGNPQMTVVFGDKLGIENEKIILPPTPEKFTVKYQSLMRGQANRLAFLQRYGNDLSLRNWVEKLNGESAQVINLLEMARTEGEGIHAYLGANEDLKKLSKEELAYHQQLEDVPLSSVVYALGLALRQAYGFQLNKEAKAYLKQFEHGFSKSLTKWLRTAPYSLSSENERLSTYNELLGILHLDHEEIDLPEISDGDVSQMSQMNKESQSDDGGEGEQREDVESDLTNPADSLTDDPEPGEGEESHEDVFPPEYRVKTSDTVAEYRVFTNQFDKMSAAKDLLDDAEKKHLLKLYNRLTKHNRKHAKQLANKLQRLLMSKAQEVWRYEKEEGIVDAAKLAQFVAGGDNRVFKEPLMRQGFDTAVTILVDNSGSMRGRPIEMASVSVDMLARTLEKCGVTVEVLGFTTRAWKGGKSHMQWIQRGKPENPGRLNDLLHVIYKDADEPYRRAFINFASMLADDLLKENVDGESILWAYKRLMDRKENRKILMVISDGAPVDYSTDRYNDIGFLDRHLRSVIHRVEDHSDVELLAVGIGHDVDRYYKNAVTIETPDELGEVLVDKFIELFTE